MSNQTKSLVSLFLPVMMLSLCGCATIINSPTQRTPMTSSPMGATVTIDGNQKYTTPTEVQLERKHDHQLLFQKDGYEDLIFVMKHVVSGVVAGNLIAGGLIGWGVDAMTGAQFKLIPETVSVTLVKADSQEAKNQMNITDKLGHLDRLLADKSVTRVQYDKAKLALLDKQNAALNNDEAEKIIDGAISASAKADAPAPQPATNVTVK